MVKDVLRQELIGCAIEVTGATNSSLIGIKGKIVDETKNTIIIKDKENRKKSLLKEQVTFIISIKDKRIEIDGKKIKKRPEKRI